LEIVVVQILDALAEPDGLLGRPHRVGIEPERITRERLGERAIALELIGRRKDAALELVRLEAVGLLELARVLDELLAGAHLARAVARIRIPKKQIRRERNAIPDLAAQDVVDGDVPLLAQDVEA